MIDVRIAQALTEPLPSGDLAALLEEATREADAAREEFARAEAAALDPRSEPEAVADARKAIADARFRCDRLANALSALNSRLDDVVNREGSLPGWGAVVLLRSARKRPHRTVIPCSQPSLPRSSKNARRPTG